MPSVKQSNLQFELTFIADFNNACSTFVLKSKLGNPKKKTEGDICSETYGCFDCFALHFIFTWLEKSFCVQMQQSKIVKNFLYPVESPFKTLHSWP